MLPESFQLLIQLPKLRINSNFQFSGIAFKGHLTLFLLGFFGWLFGGGQGEGINVIYFSAIAVASVFASGWYYHATKHTSSLHKIPWVIPFFSDYSRGYLLSKDKGLGKDDQFTNVHK